ncbi:hypothetical protein ACRRTK_006341 [Alexandromys fortis]
MSLCPNRLRSPGFSPLSHTGDNQSELEIWEFIEAGESGKEQGRRVETVNYSLLVLLLQLEGLAQASQASLVFPGSCLGGTESS